MFLRRILSRSTHGSMISSTGTRHRPGARPCVEALDQRLALSTFTVTNTLDTGAGSLRQAILDANGNAPTTVDTIIFSSLFNSPQTISCVTPLPQLGGILSIVGPGSSLLTIRPSSPVARVSGVISSACTDLTLSGMTISGGNVSGNGGGVQSTGPNGPSLLLDDILLSGNTASGLGGGLYLNNNSKLTIRNSTLSGNTALSGGGICFFQNGSLMMDACTVSGNVSTRANGTGGAGLYFAGNALTNPPAGFVPGVLLVRSSTFDHNQAATSGGGIQFETTTGTLQLQNCTLSDNTAALGGGISLTAGTGSLLLQNVTVAGNTANATFAGGGGIWRTSNFANTITLQNSVVSGNTNAGAPDISVDAFTTLHANYSAIGSGSGFTLSGSSANNLPFGAGLQLDPLAGNGGPTRTRATGAGSALLNAGSNALVPGGIVTDQRGPGFPRIAGAAVDIGAFERTVVAGPEILDLRFHFETAPHRIEIRFSQDVGASLSAADFTLRDQTHAVFIPLSNLPLTYDAGANRATFTVTGYPGGILPDARYRLQIVSAGITNTAGTPLPGSTTLFDFHALSGDANRDGRVDFDDLLLVAQNYGTSGKTFSQGNFSYDAAGMVDFDDLLLIAQRYGTVLLGTDLHANPRRRWACGLDVATKPT